MQEMTGEGKVPVCGEWREEDCDEVGNWPCGWPLVGPFLFLFLSPMLETIRLWLSTSESLNLSACVPLAWREFEHEDLAVEGTSA